MVDGWYPLKQDGSPLGLFGIAHGTCACSKPIQPYEGGPYLSLYPWQFLSTRQWVPRNTQSLLYPVESQKHIQRRLYETDQPSALMVGSAGENLQPTGRLGCLWTVVETPDPDALTSPSHDRY